MYENETEKSTKTLSPDIIILFSTLGSLIILICKPLLIFLSGLISGMVLKFFVGSQLAEGLNIIFETTRFTKESIPLICATIASIGNCLKLSSFKQSTNDKKNEGENTTKRSKDLCFEENRMNR